MEDPISINLEVQDRFGKSNLSIEGADLEDAREKILHHLNYTYQSETFADVSIEARDRTGGSRVNRTFPKIRFDEAKSRLSDFLAYIYRATEEIYIGSGEALQAMPEKKPEVKSSWLSSYELSSLSQKDKVFALLKHNHAGEWVQSQDIQQEYEIIFGEKIKLSSLSTYLARFHAHGSLERKGSRAQREYKLPGEGISALSPL
ncbi:MAG: hypothetical protein QME59_05595 [Candidatus Hydrothermarchaeota archaeon]|nr:hypothetical protein [Candidatus Hydrothermarchaeota archaeon]